MNKWIDLSLKLDEKTYPFPGDEPLKIEQLKSLKDDGYLLTCISTTMHLGTHLDFKSHMLDTLDDLDVNDFIGYANVIFINPKHGVISTRDIEMAYQYIDKKENMLLISTGREALVNTDQYFEYPKFDQKIMTFLNKHHIKLLGSDLPSFEYFDGHSLKMHKDLLSQNVYLLENLMELQKLQSHIELIVLPLPITGIEASLVRPIARNL